MKHIDFVLYKCNEREEGKKEVWTTFVSNCLVDKSNYLVQIFISLILFPLFPHTKVELFHMNVKQAQ